MELLDFDLMKSALQMDMFGSYDEHVAKFTKDKKIQTLLEWPVMFIGLSPHNAPSLYSLMTYAGHAGGTFYPKGGMQTPALALEAIAEKMGAKFQYNTTVERFMFAGDKIESVCVTEMTEELQGRSSERCRKFDGVIAAADYHHVEQNLLPRPLRRYSEQHWEEQVLSPSVILFYLGFNKRLPKLLHHTLFFDDGLAETQRHVFVDHTLTPKPAFYVSATSKTDQHVAPENGEAVFVLVPISYELVKQDTPALRQQLQNHVFERMEAKLGYSLKTGLVYQSSYGPKDFQKQYHAFKGNAFGHANLLSQSLCLKPSMDSLVANMVFAGHLTHPGPGVPPALVSGNVAATLLHKKLHPPAISFIQSIASGITNLLFWVGIFLVLSSTLMRCCLPHWNSYMRCVDLMFRHGKTYYAASTLMAWEQYIDTCCLYAIFREADDIVDNYAPEVVKRKELDEFMRRFYECRRTGIVRSDDPIIFAASIPTIRKYDYPERLWDSFFQSMASDIAHNVCRTMDDTMLYMDGSAAVLGEFMLPLLGPDHEMSPAEKEIATPHARDLGLAFQLTNMLRDIGEDLDFERQYIPVEVCNQFGIDLRSKPHTDPKFQGLMEHMMAQTDTFYASADLGIAMLPGRVRDSIQAARAMYSEIHKQIREAKYDVFSKRVKVSSYMKLKIAAHFVPGTKLFWMVLTDRVTWLVLELYYTAMPISLLLFGFLAARSLDGKNFTYEMFLTLYLGLPIFALGLYNTRHCSKMSRSAAPWVLLLCLVATVWTTPWDNYLVYRGIWGYGPDESRLSLGVIGYVPAAEYMFFSLETILCSLVWITIFNQRDPLQYPPKAPPCKRWRNIGMVALVLMGCVGVSCTFEPRLEYLGLILMWVTFPLMIQWGFGAEALISHGKCLVTSILFSTLYLCIVDQWAIKNGIWAISQKHSLPLVIPNLPIEEVTFFILTVTLCNFGLTLAMIVSHNGYKFRDVSTWGTVNASSSHLRKDAAEEAAKNSISVPLNMGVLSALGLMRACDMVVPQSMEILIMVLTTIMIGFPHGALDALLIHQNFSDSNARYWYWVQYIGLLGMGSVTWILQPEVALFLFLVMTVYHFGEGDAQSNPKSFGLIEMVARGGTFLVTIHSNHNQVVEIFTLIVGGSSVTNVMAACTIMQVGYAICTCLFIVHLLSVLHSSSAQLLLLELVALNVMYYVAPPLLAFAVYFNLYHSQRHVVRVMQMNSWRASNRLSLMVATTFTLLSTIILGLWYWSGQLSRWAVIQDARPLLRPMFVVISVLTVPHMFLVHEVVSTGRRGEVAGDVKAVIGNALPAKWEVGAGGEGYACVGATASPAQFDVAVV